MRGSLFCPQHQSCQLSPLSRWEPQYRPQLFNRNPRVKGTHNCYTYAVGGKVYRAQMTQCDGKPKGCELLYHQPGGTKGRSQELRDAKARTCAAVENLMMADVPALKRTTFDQRCPAGSSKIALVVHPGEDYHFYRQDPDAYWSHKDGSNDVKRFDAEGLPIANPQTAARDYRPRGSFLNYSNFCGFYCAPRDRPVELARGGSRSSRKMRKSSTLYGKSVRRIQSSQRTRRRPATRRIKLR